VGRARCEAQATLSQNLSRLFFLGQGIYPLPRDMNRQMIGPRCDLQALSASRKFWVLLEASIDVMIQVIRRLFFNGS